MAGKQKQKVTYVNQIESLKDVGRGIGASLVKDVGIAGGEDSWAQLLGLQGQDHHRSQDGTQPQKAGDAEATHTSEAPKSEPMSLSGMLSPNEWFVLPGGKNESHEEKPKETKKNAAPGIDYHREIATTSERSVRKNQSEMEQRFSQIKEELDRLVASSNKIVQEEFGGITTEQAPREVGKYHINFLDWMLIAIRTTREKVEDSGAWLQTMKNKKGKKGYWGMFKKHGTSFGMSNERSVATQTG